MLMFLSRHYSLGNGEHVKNHFFYFDPTTDLSMGFYTFRLSYMILFWLNYVGQINLLCLIWGMII
jgi:hypothetical protein